MADYVRHIVRIARRDGAAPDRDDYLRLVRALGEGGSRYCYLSHHDGVLDDSNWNDGEGSAWGRLGDDLLAASARIPEWELAVRSRYEFGNGRTAVLANGKTLSDRDMTDAEAEAFDREYGGEEHEILE